MTAFQPVLLGSETCAYAMARAFHSAYGLKSLVYGRMQLSVTKFSSIMEPTFFADFTEPESFRRHMVEAGRRLTSERPDTTFLLIACGDDYSELLSRYKDELKPYFTFVSVDADLHDRLSNKTSFYELCAQYDLPHPLTFVLTRPVPRPASITTCRSASPWPSSRRTASNTCTWTSPDARRRSFCTRPRSWPMSSPRSTAPATAPS